MKNSIQNKSLILPLAALTLIMQPLSAWSDQTSFWSTKTLSAGGNSIDFPLDTSDKNLKEICVIPTHFTIGNSTQYSEKDSNKEKSLCNFAWHSDKDISDPNGSVSVAICPKLNSTNPGVQLFKIPESTSDQTWNKTRTEKEFCKEKSDINSKYTELSDLEAKFKQSITCSYAPSALAAYHLSRMLGGIGNTPVSVVRTMDSKSHKKIVDKALDILQGRNNEQIYMAWNQFSKSYQTNKNPKFFTGDELFIYGALSDNKKNEFNYTEVSGVGPYDTRYMRFQKQKPFVRVSNSDDLSVIIGSSDFSQVIPVVQQMKDVSDMIVLDSLLSQDDRIGNIHFLLGRIKLSDDGTPIRSLVKKDEVKAFETRAKKQYKRTLNRLSESEISNLSINSKEKGELVRFMLLKDNDCGVDVDKRSNQMRKISAIEQVRHMSPTTYRQLMELLSLSKSKDSGLDVFFKQTLLFRDVDYSTKNSKSFLSNLIKVSDALKKNCKAGLLKLDLDVTFDSAQKLIEYNANDHEC